MDEPASLLALFASAFVSSTLFPGGSEVVLAVLARESGQPAWVLLLVATAGNTLGGMSSWAIGRVLPEARRTRRDLQRALAWVGRHGAPVLLLSWLPVVGDPLCLAAGWLRVGWAAALAYVAAGKAARYAVLLAIA